MADGAQQRAGGSHRSTVLRRSGALGGALALAGAAVVAVLFGTGFRDNDVQLRSSGAWLEHTTAGLAVHANGATALVDAKVQVASADEAADPVLAVLRGEFRIEQDAELVYLVSEDGCEVLRFDEARLNLAKIPADGTVRRVTPGEDCDRARVHADEERTFLVDEATGRIEQVDPRSLDLVPEGLVELGTPLESSISLDGRLHVVTEDGDLVTVGADGVERRPLPDGASEAHLVRIGTAVAVVATVEQDTVVVLPDDQGLPARSQRIPGLGAPRVSPRQPPGHLWWSADLDGEPVVVGVDVADGSIQGPFQDPFDGAAPGAPVAIGTQLVVPVEGNRVAVLDAESGAPRADVWPSEEEAPSRPFALLVSAGRVWANSPTGDFALRCDELGCTEVEKNDPTVETVTVTDPRQPDPPKAVSAADRQVEVPSSSTTVAPTPSTATTVGPPTTPAPAPVVDPSETRIATPPGPVRDLVGLPGDGTASLSWRPPVGEGPFRYLVEGDGVAGTAETEATAFEVGGLTNGREHTFTVRAATAAGPSSPLRVTVTPTDDVVTDARIAHVDEAGGKVLVDWTWPEGVSTAQLACRSTDGSVRFGTREVQRSDLPLVVEDAPRDHDVVCDVSTRGTVTTNVIRPVARPRVLSHAIVGVAPGEGRLTLSADLGGAERGTVTLSGPGVPTVQVPVDATDLPIALPAGTVTYQLDLAIPTDSPWGSATPATGEATITPQAVTAITGTPTTPCCSLQIAWTPPAVAPGSTAAYEVLVTEPVPSSHSGCEFGQATSCTLTWNPSDVTEPISVEVTVQAFVNGSASSVAAGGPFLLEPPGGPGPGAEPDPGPAGRLRTEASSTPSPHRGVALVLPALGLHALRPAPRRPTPHDHDEAP